MSIESITFTFEMESDLFYNPIHVIVTFNQHQIFRETWEASITALFPVRKQLI